MLLLLKKVRIILVKLKMLASYKTKLGQCLSPSLKEPLHQSSQSKHHYLLGKFKRSLCHRKNKWAKPYNKKRRKKKVLKYYHLLLKRWHWNNWKKRSLICMHKSQSLTKSSKIRRHLAKRWSSICTPTWIKSMGLKVWSSSGQQVLLVQLKLTWGKTTMSLCLPRFSKMNVTKNLDSFRCMWERHCPNLLKLSLEISILTKVRVI